MPYKANRGKYTYGLKTITEIDALTGMQAGDTVYDTTNNKPTRYTGSVWTNSDCVVLINRTGASINRGDLVIVSPTADSVGRTSIQGNPLVIGPVLHGGTALLPMAIAVSGIYNVFLNITTASVRNGILSSTTLGRATQTTNFAQDGIFGNILVGGDGVSSLYRCFLRPHAEMF